MRALRRRAARARTAAGGRGWPAHLARGQVVADEQRGAQRQQVPGNAPQPCIGGCQDLPAQGAQGCSGEKGGWGGCSAAAGGRGACHAAPMISPEGWQRSGVGRGDWRPGGMGSRSAEDGQIAGAATYPQQRACCRGSQLKTAWLGTQNSQRLSAQPSPAGGRQPLRRPALAAAARRRPAAAPGSQAPSRRRRPAAAAAAPPAPPAAPPAQRPGSPAPSPPPPVRPGQHAEGQGRGTNAAPGRGLFTTAWCDWIPMLPADLNLNR